MTAVSKDKMTKFSSSDFVLDAELETTSISDAG